MSDARLKDIEDRLAATEEQQAATVGRLACLEAHRLHERVAILEAGFLRMERQIDLVVAQGHAASRSSGELLRARAEDRILLDYVAGLLKQLVHQQTPSVEVRG